MRAYTIKENLNFKRSIDPKKILGLGFFYNIPIEEIRSKDIMKELGFKWKEEMVEEDTNSEGDDQYIDIWSKDGMEIGTNTESDDVPFSFWAWNISNGTTMDVYYKNLNPKQLLDKIKSEARDEMEIEF